MSEVRTSETASQIVTVTVACDRRTLLLNIFRRFPSRRVKETRSATTPKCTTTNRLTGFHASW